MLFAVVPSITQAAIDLTCRSVLGLLAVVGSSPVRDADVLSVGPVAVRIVADCTPLFAFAALASAVLAYPAPWSLRLTGLLCAFPVIWMWNTARILGSLWVLIRAPRHFELAHDLLWQTVTLALVLGLFAIWLRRVPVSILACRHSR